MVVGSGAAKAPASWSKGTPYRVLSLSPDRVEVRLYRRSRTSSSIAQEPCHFEYFLRCQWSGSQRRPQDTDVSGIWWDELPSSYDIRRRWTDIVRFHEALSELASTATNAHGTRMPQLPSKGNIDEFTKNLAATGDACALGKGRLRKEGSSHDDLSILHSVYVENRLTPYFKQVSAILSEIFPEALLASKAIRHFTTSGPSSLQKRAEQAFDIPMDQASLEAASQALRESAAWRSAVPTRKSLQAQLDTPVGDQLGAGQSVISEIFNRSPIRRSTSTVHAPDFSEMPPKDHRALIPTHGGNHYNFFARFAPSEAFGSSSDRELIRRMVAKERRERAHHTLLEASGRHFEPSERTVLERPQVMRSSVSLLAAGTKVTSQELMQTSAAASGNLQNLKLQMMMADLCAGLRCVILGAEPPDGQKGRQRNKPVEIKATDMSEGSKESVLKVYQSYRKLLEEETLTRARSPPDTEHAADAETDDEAAEDDQRQRKYEQKRMAYVRDLGVSHELMPINWHTFFMWIEHKSDLTDDCRLSSTYHAFLRALKHWRQQEATMAQCHLGVSLNMLLQWIWPKAAYTNVARMLTWIGQHEFEKIRQPTPPVIRREDQNQIESIFNILDVQRCGHITAEDIAGREKDCLKAKLRSIVDADTVKAVYGGGPISLEQFLEIMCEDNFRGHVDATVAQLSNGNRLMKVQRDVTGCCGWISQDAPKSEGSQRDLVHAIEIEVSRWNSIAPYLDQVSRKNRVVFDSCCHSEKYFIRGNVLEPMECLPSNLIKLRNTLRHSFSHDHGDTGWSHDSLN